MASMVTIGIGAEVSSLKPSYGVFFLKKKHASVVSSNAPVQRTKRGGGGALGLAAGLHAT